MKKFILFLPVLALFSCSSSSDDQVQKKTPKEKESILTVESMSKRHIESKLAIPATEKYSYHIYKEHLDGDNKIDAIITVNRLEFAMDEAAKSNNTAKSAELGFMGNYNYIFFYDGGLNQISPQIAIPSSPKSELKVEFENIQSDVYKDVLIQFRVLNAAYLDFYAISNHLPRRVFQWKVYDGLLSNKSEAYSFEYGEGTLGPIKDILIKKAVLIQPSESIDIYSYEPQIKQTNEIVHRFFYHPSTQKYMTQK